MSSTGATGPFGIVLSARTFDEIAKKLEKLDPTRYGPGALTLSMANYIIFERQREPAVAPDGRSPMLHPCVGDCVATRDGKRRRLVMRTTRYKQEPFDPRTIPPGSWLGYNVWYTKTADGKEQVCWLATWQEWCRKNQVIMEAAS